MDKSLVTSKTNFITKMRMFFLKRTLNTKNIFRNFKKKPITKIDVATAECFLDRALELSEQKKLSAQDRNNLKKTIVRGIACFESFSQIQSEYILSDNQFIIDSMSYQDIISVLNQEVIENPEILNKFLKTEDDVLKFWQLSQGKKASPRLFQYCLDKIDSDDKIIEFLRNTPKEIRDGYWEDSNGDKHFCVAQEKILRISKNSMDVSKDFITDCSFSEEQVSAIFQTVNDYKKQNPDYDFSILYKLTRTQDKSDYDEKDKRIIELVYEEIVRNHKNYPDKLVASAYRLCSDEFQEQNSEIASKVLDYIVTDKYTLMQPDHYLNDISHEIQNKYPEKIYASLEKTLDYSSGTNRESNITILLRKINLSPQIILQNLEFFEFENTEFTQNQLKDICRRNDEVFKTICPSFVKEEYMKCLKGKYETLALFPEAQNLFINFLKGREWDSTIRKEFLERAFEQLGDSEEEYGDIFNKIIKCEDKNSESLITEASVKNYQQNLSEDDISKIIQILGQDNPFGIENFDQLRNYEKIKNDICKAIIENPNGNFSVNSSIYKLKSEDKVRFAVLQLKYGITLADAKQISQYFPEHSQDEFINGINDILSSDIEQLRTMDYSEVGDIDYAKITKIKKDIIQNYAKTYRESVFRPENFENPSNVENKKEYSPVKCGNRTIQVFDAGTNFNMMINVVGAYSKYEAPTNFADAWNIPKEGSRHICTSYISNNMIGTARLIKSGPIYGFAELDDKSLIVSSKTDLVSEDKRQNFGEFDMGFPEDVAFLSPEKLINNTRHNHNESCYNRLKIDEKGNIIKQQPSYVIYISDGEDVNDLDSMEFKDTETSEEINDEPKELIQDKKRRWEETKRAAADFGIPIVVIDRIKCIEKSQNIINSELNFLEQEIKSGQNVDLSRFEKIINEFENNRIGSCYAPENSPTKEIFSFENLGKKLNQMMEMISSCENPSMKKACYEKLKEVCQAEVAKNIDGKYLNGLDSRRKTTSN